MVGSLWHEDSWLPCKERFYDRRPYAIKNQRGASQKTRPGYFDKTDSDQRDSSPGCGEKSDIPSGVAD